MANPICLSPLKFYDSLAKQSHRKSYAYNHITPIITKTGWLPPFQFVVSDSLVKAGANASYWYLINAKNDEVVQNITTPISQAGLKRISVEGFRVVYFKSIQKVTTSIKEGYYYIKVNSSSQSTGKLLTFYSEVFCFTNVTKDCLELEYWNETGNFAIKNGVIAFPSGFHFKLLLKGEIGKPEYNFEEESTKRLGYTYVESQVSKKIYKFNVVVPEYICDALRIVRLCDNKIIRCKDDEYEAISFEMEADWQTQGDLASVTCEFETDNVIANIGGFVPDKLGGDYNNDYDDDFDKE